MIGIDANTNVIDVQIIRVTFKPHKAPYNVPIHGWLSYLIKKAINRVYIPTATNYDSHFRFHCRTM